MVAEEFQDAEGFAVDGWARDCVVSVVFCKYELRAAGDVLAVLVGDYQCVDVLVVVVAFNAVSAITCRSL